MTFTADYRPAGRFVASCGCRLATELAAPHRTYELALAEVLAAPAEREALPGCEMPDICPHYPLYVHEADPDGDVPEVNIGARNSVRLAHLLGFEAPEPAGTLAALSAAERAGDTTSAVAEAPAVGDGGQMPAEEFLGRVLIALALTPEDAGVEGYWDGRWFTGGRSAGHLQMRLLELHALAQWCALRGRDVAWG
ncbi:hypothetical protein [Streptomyces sp. NBC_00239]|uniref:hypothetical protein n=1 Tax=Streptomyces sp. NBC_00239 TaxID=2903640 RepID=UPI002E2D457F|nr:hypothetical protein [Streptomyces sp. NBC_00239]